MSSIDQASISRYEPIPYRKQEPLHHHLFPDFKGKNLNKCLIMAAVGSIFAFIGLVILWAMYKKREVADLLMGDKSRRATARITGKRHYVEKSDDRDTHHWVASYTFEGVRADGMRCSVTVNEREFKQTVWDMLQVGQDAPVYYAAFHPGRCRLGQQAIHEHADTRGCEFYMNSFLAAVFTVVGCFLGFLSVCCGFQTSGVMGLFLCIGLFVICTGGLFFAVKSWVEAYVVPGVVKVKELGLQEKAGHLTDLSGLWLLESDFGRFEYRFEAVDATTVLAKGRPEGTEAWDAEFEAHFGGNGDELVWEDDEKADFRLQFNSSDSFTGSRCTGDSPKVTFTGSRVPAASEATEEP